MTGKATSLVHSGVWGRAHLRGATLGTRLSGI